MIGGRGGRDARRVSNTQVPSTDDDDEVGTPALYVSPARAESCDDGIFAFGRFPPTCQKVTQLASLAPAKDVEDGGQSAMASRAVSTSRGLCAGDLFPFSPRGAVQVA